jgi:hypothetical protein
MESYFLKKYHYEFQENKEAISKKSHLTFLAFKNSTLVLKNKLLFDEDNEENRKKIEERMKVVPNIPYMNPVLPIDQTPLEDVHTLFISLFLKTLFVVDMQGRLYGVIIRDGLARFEGDRLTTLCIPHLNHK